MFSANIYTSPNEFAPSTELPGLTWTMATTYAYYLFACPHPLVSPPARIKRLKLDSETDGKTLLGRLGSTCLEHSDDLKAGVVWKASRSTLAQLPP